MTDFAHLRRDMVERQIAGRDLDDPAMLDAFLTVPRELFVAPAYGHEAYADRPLPIDCGRPDTDVCVFEFPPPSPPPQPAARNAVAATSMIPALCRATRLHLRLIRVTPFRRS